MFRWSVFEILELFIATSKKSLVVSTNIWSVKETEVEKLQDFVTWLVESLIVNVLKDLKHNCVN